MSINIDMQRIFFLSIALVTLCGCLSRITPGNQVSTAQNAVNKQEAKVDLIVTELEKNEKRKVNQTSTLSAGIQHSLNQVTNPPVQVNTAKALNERIISIVGSPNIDEAKRIKATVDLLNAQVIEERKKGEKMLNERDEIIARLQKEKNQLKEKYDDELWQMSDKAMQIAKESDAKQATIDTMGGMFGLNAVIWGLKKFFFSFLTFIIVFGVIFIILRILAATNPIAAGAFSIFNLIGSTVVSIMKALTPKAFEICNMVPADQKHRYKETLTKIVDAMQDLKEKQQYGQTFNLKDIFERFSKEMSDSEKSVIDDILKEQKWVK